MKLIVDCKTKKGFSIHCKNTIRNLLIVFSYTFGFALYTFIFLICKVEVKDICLAWISVPAIGFILSILHLFYIYKGNLICRAITMLAIMFFVFVIPFLITFM